MTGSLIYDRHVLVEGDIFTGLLGGDIFIDLLQGRVCDLDLSEEVWYIAISGGVRDHDTSGSVLISWP